MTCSMAGNNSPICLEARLNLAHPLLIDQLEYTFEIEACYQALSAPSGMESKRAEPSSSQTFFVYTYILVAHALFWLISANFLFLQ